MIQAAENNVFQFHQVTSLAFNSTTSELSFTVSGFSGTAGYVKATIAKSVVSNAENMKVYLDGNRIDYEVASNVDSWLLSFTYAHSTHQVSTNFETTASETTILGIECWMIVVAITVATVGTSLLFYVKKRKQTT